MSTPQDCQFCGPNQLTVVHLREGGYGVRIVDKRGMDATYGREDGSPFNTREEAMSAIDDWIATIQESAYQGIEFRNER